MTFLFIYFVVLSIILIHGGYVIPTYRWGGQKIKLQNLKAKGSQIKIKSDIFPSYEAAELRCRIFRRCPVSTWRKRVDGFNPNICSSILDNHPK